MLGVGQTNKWQSVLGKVGCKLLGVFWPDNQDSHISFGILFMVLAQLRHVRAAEGSGKAPIKNQKNMLFPTEVG